MSNRIGAWLALGIGCGVLIAGCSGGAQESAPGGAGSASHASGGENSGVSPEQDAAETAKSAAGSGNSTPVSAVRGSEGIVEI